MKYYLVILAVFFLLINVRIFFKTIELRTKIYTIGLIFIFLLTINVKFFDSFNDPVYINLGCIYLIFLWFITKTELNIKISKVYLINQILLIIVYCMYIYQLISLEIYDYSLYISNLCIFIVINILFIYFRYISEVKISIQFFFKLIVWASLANSFLGLLQFITNKTFLLGGYGNITYGIGSDAVRRAIGFVGANNGAGNFAAILFPVLLYNFIKRKNIINILAVIMNIIFVILTLTRIGYLAIAFQFFIFILFGVKGKYKNLKRIAIILLISIVALFIIKSYGTLIYENLFLKRGDTQNSRFTQFDLIFNILKNDNIFTGIGSGQYTFYLYYKYLMLDIVIHSQYLNVLAETGIIVFIIFVFINISLFIKVLRVYKNEWWLPISLFLGNFICSNFNPNQYYMLNNFVYFFVILVLIYSDRSNMNIESHNLGE